MSKKYKLTGCARFFIFLLIVAPIVYFAVSYFQGENPFTLLKDTVENVKEQVETRTPNSTKDDSSTATDNETTTLPSSDVDETSILNGTIKAQKKRIDDQNDYIETLENQIEQLKAQLKKVKARDIPVRENIEN